MKLHLEKAPDATKLRFDEVGKSECYRCAAIELELLKTGCGTMITHIPHSESAFTLVLSLPLEDVQRVLRQFCIEFDSEGRSVAPAPGTGGAS